MRRIIRRRELVADDARYPGEDSGPDTRSVQPVAQFIAALGAGQQSGSAAAVLIGPGDEVEELAPHLARLSLIVVEFPKIGEGRGYSQARMLRQRHGYTGELRARGAIKRDQLFLLARCGFDSFDLDPAEDLQLALGSFNDFSVAYQDGSDAVVQVRRRAGAGGEGRARPGAPSRPEAAALHLFTAIPRLSDGTCRCGPPAGTVAVCVIMARHSSASMRHRRRGYRAAWDRAGYES
jgi:uncharacterized protein (DUF934 family)